MKAIKTTIDGSACYLFYNAEAMFELEERIESDSLVDALLTNSREGFENTLTAAAILSEQGELARRACGCDAGTYLNVDALRQTITPAGLAALRRDIIDAMCLGVGQTVEQREDDVVDLGLAETEKKTS